MTRGSLLLLVPRVLMFFLISSFFFRPSSFFLSCVVLPFVLSPVFLFVFGRYSLFLVRCPFFSCFFCFLFHSLLKVFLALFSEKFVVSASVHCMRVVVAVSSSTSVSSSHCCSHHCVPFSCMPSYFVFPASLPCSSNFFFPSNKTTRNKKKNLSERISCRTTPIVRHR